MKNFDEKYWQRLLDIEAAFESQWKREVSNNKDLQADITELQYEYNLPLVQTDIITLWCLEEVNRWTEENPDRNTILNEEIEKIITKHQIDSRWHNGIYYLLVLGVPHSRNISLGFPSGKFKLENGEVKHEFIITPDVDISNPIVQDYMKSRLLIYDQPPQPICIDESSGKLDWRPVWEWKKRHPGVTYDDMARLMSYHPVTISKALSRLDKEN